MAVECSYNVGIEWMAMSVGIEVLCSLLSSYHVGELIVIDRVESGHRVIGSAPPFLDTQSTLTLSWV